MFDFETRADKAAAVTAIYVGYFNRAPDPVGLDFWIGELTAGMGTGRAPNAVLLDVANAFSVSAEAAQEYPLFEAATPDRADIEDFVATVFQNVFDRAPDDAGLEFWANELEARSPGQAGRIILDILSGAQGDDRTAIDNKILVGRGYAEAFVEEGGTWTAADDREAAVSLIDNVTSDSATVAAGEAEARNLARAAAAPETFAADIDVSFDDPLGDLVRVEDDIAATLDAAWDLWAANFDLDNDASIEVEVRADEFAPEGVLASTVSVVSGLVPEAPLDPDDAFSPLIPGAVSELRTGEDVNGDDPDIVFNMPLTSVDEFAYRTDFDDPIGLRQFDGLTVFAHEFGHALAMDGFIDSFRDDAVTLYDSQVLRLGDGFVFTGENATAVAGEAVALRDDDPYHLAAPADLMSPTIPPGEGVEVSDLDLAILKDAGVPIANDAFIA